MSHNPAPHAPPHTPMPIDIRQWQKKDHNVKIEKFVCTAVKMPNQFNPEDPRRQLIHWRGGGAYVTKDGTRSTSFDTRKLNHDPEIEVQFISKPFAVSANAPYHWESKLATEYTTTQVYDLLVDKKFDHYLYNGTGSGCLTWTTALVELLETEGVLPQGSKASFEEVVEKVRVDPEYWVPAEPGAQFYN